MDLGTAFAVSAARMPDALAIVDGEQRLSYGDWYDHIRRVAGGLRSLGLAPGDRFVPVLANTREMATLYWACQMLGVVFTPFNWRASADEIAYVLDNADASFVAFDDRSRDAVIAAAHKIGAGESLLISVGEGDGSGTTFAELAGAPPIDGPAGPDERETSLMLYTSGTTGRPKGVPRSHAAERTAAVSCIAQLGYRPGERSLGVMPLFHTMGIRALLMSTMLDGAFVCMATFDAEGAMRLVAAERISALFLVPTMFHDIVNHSETGRYDLGSVRNIGYAGMSMTTGLTAQCAALFKPESFTNYYGSSEIYTFTVRNDVGDKPGCAGRAGLNQEIRIARADPDGLAGPDELVPPGETGEIIATMASPEAFTGYWKRPDADAKAIRGGWYFTGDLGMFDEDGELHIVGRVDDMIISGGENIHPEEVEDVLDKSPLVRQAAVIGLPDPRLGHKVVAFIEPASDDASAAILDAACLDSDLANFKRPRAYVFVERIPRSASGKLLRRFLRTGDYTVLPQFESTL